MYSHSKSSSTLRYAVGTTGIALWVLLSAGAVPAHASALGDFSAGYDAMLKKNYDQAILRFTSAIATGDLKPANLALAYHYRGAEYLKTGRDDDAIADLDRAVALNPTLETAYYDRAIAHKRKGDYASAIADYSAAIKLNPDLNYFYLYRGQAYAANNQVDEAIADYKRALYYSPNSVPAFVSLGDAYYKQGRNGEALAAYQEAMRRKGNLLEVYSGLPARLAELNAAPAHRVVLDERR
jgi:tetratricopeptide (TPR) repeat protein